MKIWKILKFCFLFFILKHGCGHQLHSDSLVAQFCHEIPTAKISFCFVKIAILCKHQNLNAKLSHKHTLGTNWNLSFWPISERSITAVILTGMEWLYLDAIVHVSLHRAEGKYFHGKETITPCYWKIFVCPISVKLCNLERKVPVVEFHETFYESYHTF